MAMSLEEMYKLALNPKLFPDSRLLAVMQGHDKSLPMAVAMSAKQMRDKQETAAKGAQAQAQAGTPSVRDQMIAKSAPQAGIDQLRAPTMENMGETAMGAGGGIVSMSQGGFGLDDDESDPEQDDQDELDAMMAQHGDLGGLGAGIMAVANPAAARYSSITKPATASIISASKTISGDNKGISNILSNAAEKHNLPTDLLARIAHSESGGRADIKNPHSTAKGLFQFTDKTWKGMGGKEGEQFNPERNADLGAAYLRQNAEGLKKTLGRDPTYGEVYGAHHFGLAGIKNMLNKKHDTPIDRVVSRQVISSNPYLKGKTVGDTLSFLNSKAGTGVVSLAQGGHIKHFLTGDLVQTNFGEAAGPDIRTKQIVDDFGNVVEETRKKGPKLSPYERLKGAGIGGVKNALKVSAVPSAVYEGGKYATTAAANTLHGNPEMAKAYFGSDYNDPGGDNAFAYNILKNADPKKKDLSSLGLEYYGNDSPQAQAERAAAAIKNTAPAINQAPTNTGKSGGAADKDTGPTVSVTPKDTSQDYLTRYLSNLESDRKQNAGLSAILAGLTTAGTAGPLSSALSKGAQTGIGAYSDMQKGNQTAMAHGLAAQAAANRNAIYEQHYLGEPSEVRTLRAIAADPKLAQLYKGMGKTQQISRQDALKEFNDLMPTQQKKYKDFNDYYNQVNGIMPVYQTADVGKGAKIREQ